LISRYNTHGILQRHPAVSPPQHAFLVGIRVRPFKCWNSTHFTGFHGHDAKSWR